MLNDVQERGRSGKVCTVSHGREIIWNGHLCEGSNLTAPIGDKFCLWTRCGEADVPANKAHEGDVGEVTCDACRAIWNGENGQFGLGA